MNGLRIFASVVAAIAVIIVVSLFWPVGAISEDKEPATATGSATVEINEALGAADRQVIEKVIRDYLIANPEVLVEAQQALEIKQAEEARSGQKQTIASASDAIFQSPHNAVLGNPDGDVTIVEFFDYNCSYCKRALADMEVILEDDKDVRFALKEFPILGPDSLAAHRVAIALKAIEPGQYDAFHRALLEGEARADEARAIEVAAGLGVSEEKLREAMASEDVQAETDAAFQEAYQLAESLSITGTPSYVVGDEVVFGALGAEILREKISNVRKCGSADCS